MLALPLSASTRGAGVPNVFQAAVRPSRHDSSSTTHAAAWRTWMIVEAVRQLPTEAVIRTAPACRASSKPDESIAASAVSDDLQMSTPGATSPSRRARSLAVRAVHRRTALLGLYLPRASARTAPEATLVPRGAKLCAS